MLNFLKGNDNFEKIIEGCRNNNKSFQKKLYEKYAGSLMGVTVRYFKEKEKIDDVLQKSFINIFNELYNNPKINLEVKDEKTFILWMKKIVINISIKELDGKIVFEDIKYTPNNIENNKDIENITAEKILEALQSLPDGYRTVFNLHAIDDYKHGEIARLLAISESTSKYQYTIAKQKLLELFS